METTRCNLCGSDQSEPLYQLYDYRLSRLDVRVWLVKCKSCGLVYQNPRYTLEEMQAHYPPEYEPYQTPAASGERSAGQSIHAYGVHKRCRFVTRHKPDGGRLLEIGCAGGEFLHAMAQTPGWTVKGVEINPDIAVTARQNYGLDVFTGTLEAARFPDASFDAVVLWDVLEHLHAPLESLQEIYRILRPKGILALRVPQLDSWDAAWFGSYWAGYDPPRHLYVFSQASLTHMLHRAGFAICERSGRLGGYPMFTISVRFWMTGRNVPSQRRRTVEKVLAHPLTTLAVAPFFFASSLLRRSGLITMVAQKPITPPTDIPAPQHG